jgi:Ca2+-dependent lipid-binding protein
LKSDNFYRKAIIEKRQFSHVRLSWIISHVRLSLLSVLEISIKHYTLYNNSFYFGYRSPIRSDYETTLSESDPKWIFWFRNLT